MWQGFDRRKFPRTSCPCKITLYSKDQAEVISCRTENIGEGGICTVLKEALRLFTLVGLELSLDDSHAPMRCAGRVVWLVGRHSASVSKPKPEEYDTGIEFVDLKDDEKKRLRTFVKNTIA